MPPRKQNHELSDEAERRVALFEDRILRQLGIDETDPERSRIALAHLLMNAHIWRIAKPMAAPKSRKKDQSVKHPPEALIDVVNTFEQFSLQQKDECARKGLPTKSIPELFAMFAVQNGERFPWLPESPETFQRLLREGRKCRQWPRVAVNGSLRIVHPDQAAALAALWRVSFLQGAVSKRAEVLLLRADRHGDADVMKELKSECVLWVAGASRSLRLAGLEIPTCALLKEIPDEIQNTFASSD
jgi:hypothetical protein